MADTTLAGMISRAASPGNLYQEGTTDESDFRPAQDLAKHLNKFTAMFMEDWGRAKAIFLTGLRFEVLLFQQCCNSCNVG